MRFNFARFNFGRSDGRYSPRGSESNSRSTQRRVFRALLGWQQLEARDLFAVVSSGMLADATNPHDSTIAPVIAYATPQAEAASQYAQTPSITAEGEEPVTSLATSSAVTVPKPFWRKTEGQPTFAPDWYANQGAVTTDVYYDASKTSAENGAALKSVVDNLTAGERIRIHAGTYSVDSFFLVKAAGTAAQPVVIEGAPGERVVITRVDASQNVVNFDQSQYLLVQNLEISGGSTGVKLYDVSQLMLYQLNIHHTTNNGVAANSRNTSYLYFVDNEIHHTNGHAEGFYLGSNDGTIITHHTFVIGNYIHDLGASSGSYGDGVDIKDKSYAVTVKYNFIDGTYYPGITVYRTGRGMVDRNLIEENVILHTTDTGIQTVGEAIVRNNLVIGNTTAFMAKPFTTNPQYLTVVNNTFISGGATVRAFSWNSADIVFANNAIHSSSGQYNPTGTGQATTSGNVLVSNLATAFANLKLDGSALDATPIAGSPLIGAATATYLPPLDLTGTGRVTAGDVGAVDFRSDGATINQPPSVSISSAIDGFNGVRGQLRTFQLSAIDSATDLAAGLAYNVDWGDGSKSTYRGGASLTIGHAYANEGDYTIQVSAVDQAGLRSSVANQSQAIVISEQQGSQLVIGGTANDDSWKLLTAATGELAVQLNGATIGTVTALTNLHLIGNGGSDLLMATDQNNVWQLSGNQAGGLNGTVSFEGIDRLIGGAGSDQFQFDSSAVGFASIQGGAGVDQLDYSLRTTAVSASLQAKSSSGVTTFSGIEQLIGSQATSDRLTGADVANTWSINALNAGSVGSIQFSNFENLRGGISKDTFRLTTTSASVTGQVDGGAGADAFVAASVSNLWKLTGNAIGSLNAMPFQSIETLTGGSAADRFQFSDTGVGFSSIYAGGGYDALDLSLTTRATTLDLAQKTFTGVDSFSSLEQFIGSQSTSDWILGANSNTTWSITGLNSGRVGSLDFTNVENLGGGTASDTFKLTASIAKIDGRVLGGLGSDSLIGANLTNDWLLGTSGTIALNGKVFESFENATGGTGTDSFRVQAGATGLGIINGGSGVDTLSYAAATLPVTIDLQNKSATGLAQFVSLEKFIGGSSASDTLIGLDSDIQWKIAGANTGTVGNLSFAAMEQLRGGSGNDDFVWTNTGIVSGIIDGGAGFNSLDYSQWTTGGVTVDLSRATATAIGQLSDVQLVIGTTATDDLRGSAGDDLLIGGAGNDTLWGNGGRDMLFGGSGMDEMRGGAGEDWLYGGRVAAYSETSKSLSLPALRAMRSDWLSSDALTTRVTSLLSNQVNSSSFINDADAVDSLYGEGDSDWFLEHWEDIARDASGELITTL